MNKLLFYVLASAKFLVIYGVSAWTPFILLFRFPLSSEYNFMIKRAKNSGESRFLIENSDKSLLYYVVIVAAYVNGRRPFASFRNK